MIFVTLLEDQAGDDGWSKANPLVASTRGLSGIGCKGEQCFFPALLLAMFFPVKPALFITKIMCNSSRDRNVYSDLNTHRTQSAAQSSRNFPHQRVAKVGVFITQFAETLCFDQNQ